MARVRVSGDRATILAMRAIKSSTNRSMDPIAKKALEPMRLNAKMRATPHRQPTTPSGSHVDEGIVVAKIKSRPVFREFWVAMRGRGRRLGHLLEWGTAPHWQPRRNRMHPGARAHPFMGPAFDATRNTVTRLVSSGFWKVISAAALRYGSRR